MRTLTLWDRKPLDAADALDREGLGLALALANGADVEAKRYRGETSLMIAANEGWIAGMKLLMDAGADPHARDEAGMFPLMHAAWGGRVEASKMLLAAGARIDEVDGNLETALLRASGNGAFGVVALLADSGANLEIEDKFGMAAAKQRVRAAKQSVWRSCSRGVASSTKRRSIGKVR